MSLMPKNDFEHLRKKIETEFPEDPALQQIHLARKILAREAEEQKLSYFEYVKRLQLDLPATKVNLTHQEFEGKNR